MCMRNAFNVFVVPVKHFAHSVGLYMCTFKHCFRIVRLFSDSNPIIISRGKNRKSRQQPGNVNAIRIIPACDNHVLYNVRFKRHTYILENFIRHGCKRIRFLFSYIFLIDVNVSVVVCATMSTPHQQFSVKQKFG